MIKIKISKKNIVGFARQQRSRSLGGHVWHGRWRDPERPAALVTARGAGRRLIIKKNNDYSAELNLTINLASQRLWMLKTLWSSRELTVRTILDVLESYIFSRLLYAAVTWTTKAADSSKLLTFEMRCYRRILKVCWKDSYQQNYDRKNREALHCGWSANATDTETVWPHLSYEGSTTSKKFSDVGNDGRWSTLR